MGWRPVGTTTDRFEESELSNPRIAVVGATGAVGAVFLSIIEERKFPFEEIKLLASSRSAGKRLKVGGQEIEVEETTLEAFRDVDIAFVSATTAVSQALIPAIVEAGAVVIDDSAVYRMDPQVPLVVPEINADDLKEHRGIVAIPNCSTTQMAMALYPLHRANPIKRLVADSYQSVSGAGGAAIAELQEQWRSILDGAPVRAEAFPHQIANNVLPEIGSPRPDGYTSEEWKMVEETRKIMHAPEIAISATCVRVPVSICHSEAVHVEFTEPMSVGEARELLEAFPGVTVVDDLSTHQYPMATLGAGRDEVFVGRIRKDASHVNGLAMWIVSDNLRKGAALNAIQIAEELVKQNLFLSGKPS
ncbi:MAG: aspartate-semialdehyde dehydrogenase [Chloroflexi bacterium]|jgi:aspartate-semialdehyde dehydrogenase|nr:MAG: aspartate-semialdehyde dehydrogenase [Chloroflexota bacterium]